MKIIRSAILAALSLGLLFAPACEAAAGTEGVDSFVSEIRLNKDASLDIAETIIYETGANARHGIYREIPFRYRNAGGDRTVSLGGFSVTNEDGTPYRYALSDQGDYKELKIGDADVLLAPGKHTYVIRYRARRAVSFLGDRDEVYWNATGNGWRLPIKSASAHIILPTGVAPSEVRSACYAGPADSTRACQDRLYDDVAGLVLGARFTESDLAVGEGLTAAIGIPKGIIRQPSRQEEMIAFLADNPIIVLPLLVFLLMFALWWTKGRDPKGRGTIIPEYDVPDQLSPAEVGTIVDERCAQREISAEIIQLAIAGYLKLTRHEDKILFLKTTGYTFKKLKDAEGLDEVFDRDIMGGIFHAGETAELSTLKKDFYTYYDKATKAVYDSVTRRGYFASDPRKVMASYAVAAFGLFVLLFIFGLAGGAMTVNGSTVLALGASFFIIIVFSGAMPKRTVQGVLAKEHILGFKDYMSVAEKDRLDFHNAPRRNPEEFERLLPYAIALGVEKEWAKQFEDIYMGNPSWYEDPSGLGGFHAVALASSLGDFNTSFATAASAPSGGSGAGGGGFSGGGFGGGGGGSW